VLHGSFFYTPPRHLQILTANLAFLPAWYGNEGDYVLCSNNYPNLPEAIRPPVTVMNIANLIPERRFPPLQAAPWGISQHILKMFKDLKETCLPEIALSPWNERYIELAGRQTAALCLKEIRSQLTLPVVPDLPKFYSDAKDVARFLEKTTGSFVLKAPYSSSGRGLLWVQGRRTPVQAEMQRICGTIRRQGSISIEQALDRKLDFALEFYADGHGNVKYEGLSVFYTNEKGVYKNNQLAPQDQLWQLLESYLGNDLRNILPEAAAKALSRVYAHHYTGYLGIDMFIYQTSGGWNLHPCVEVNLRYTMGLVAIKLFERLISEHATGKFFIDFYKDGALNKHQLMQAEYPAQISCGKLSSGYLSLCPVDQNTHYIAGVVIAP
jgi:hypothetical protein